MPVDYLHLVDPNYCPTCGTLHAPDAKCPGPPVTTYSTPDDLFVWVDAPPPAAKPAPEIEVYTVTVRDEERDDV